MGEKKFIVAIVNLYNVKDGRMAYYRKQGDSGFSFCWNIKYATRLTKQEKDNVLEHEEWYLKQFGADKMNFFGA